MQGYLALVLHAHLPFVRHPEHERFLEENWLYEAITETYLPLLQLLEGWRRDALPVRLSMTLSPTLCSMLTDPLLQDRYVRHLEGLIELAERETYRTHWDKEFHPLALMYHQRFLALRETYFDNGRNLVAAFRQFQQSGHLEIITTAATHAILPLLSGHPPSMRAQIMVARDHYRASFGMDPQGIWLPECAYAEGVDRVLQEAGLRWFILDTHGLIHAQPRPRYGVFAPIYTPTGLAAFGRDLESAKQVWSKHEGFPGDPCYRDFYRDIGFDLDYDYVKGAMPVEGVRSFTGVKYHAIGEGASDKRIYNPQAARQIVTAHAEHFLEARLKQIQHLARIMDRPPLLICPYDAELFGHWWYEGPEFLDCFLRQAILKRDLLELTTPHAYLKDNPTQQVAQPSPSTWGEEGYLKVWLNEGNEWIYRHLNVAQERMTALVRMFPHPTGATERALNQAGRELLLAQSSDWAFIIRTNTSPDYARKRIKDHLLRFISLHEQLTTTQIDQTWLSQIEAMDNLFPQLDHRYWGPGTNP